MDEGSDPDAELLAFVAELGAAMSTVGEPVYVVQERLTRVAGAYGARSATVSAFPTYLMVSLGLGKPAAVELTTTLSESPQLDQIAALDLLLTEAERAAIPHATGGTGCTRSATCVRCSID